jgi:translation initiation factor IF-3
VIGEDGEQFGIMSAKEALELAAEKKLDLVKIAPQAVPPVCRIMDYGKHKYEVAKRDKEARKKQKVVEIKEVRLGLNIEEHDLETKVKMAEKFLQKGDKVKVSLRFRGREMGHINLGEAVIKRFAELIAESGDIEKKSSMEGRTLVAIFTPKK